MFVSNTLELPTVIAATDITQEIDPKAYNTPELDALIRQAISGDQPAFNTIWEQYYRRVYSLCLRMLQNTSSADDLTQEVFIQVFRKLKTYKGESAFSTWLHRLTVNQVLMHWRKRTVKFEKTTDEGVLPEQIVLGSERATHMNVIDRLAIDEAISQLPDGYRRVFILHDIEGYEHEEVARILRCSIGTSKSQLHKARLKMRRLLKKKTNPRLIPLRQEDTEDVDTGFTKTVPVTQQPPQQAVAPPINPLQTAHANLQKVGLSLEDWERIAFSESETPDDDE